MALHKLRDETLLQLRAGGPRLSDGQGLYLTPARDQQASHGWRFDYSYEGKRKTLSLGTYPAISLASAREAAQRLREELALGHNPSDTRKQERADLRLRLQDGPRTTAKRVLQGSFEEVARRWFEGRKNEWMETYSTKLLRRLTDLHRGEVIAGARFPMRSGRLSVRREH